MPQEEEDLEFFEIDIQEKRQLPYSLTVERVEGDLVYTHNQWGNSIVYKRQDSGNYEIVGPGE